jgi:hypothetical protein
MQWTVGRPVCPLVLSAVFDVADRPAVVRVDDLRAAFPPTAAGPVITKTAVETPT